MNAKKILEIVNGKGDNGLLKKSELFHENDIIDMSLLLNVGPIKNIDVIDSRYVCNQIIPVKEKINLLKDKLKEYSCIRIWYSSLNSEDYNFFLFLVYFINKNNKDIIIKQVDVGKVVKNDKIRFGAYWNLGCYDKSEIEGLLEFEKKLTSDEISNISNEWKKFQDENSDLRVLVNGKLKSRDYSFLDEKIIEEISKYEAIEETRLIVDLMNRESSKHDMGGIYGMIIFLYRISELIKQNNIELVRIYEEKNRFDRLERVNIIKFVKN